MLNIIHLTKKETKVNGMNGQQYSLKTITNTFLKELKDQKLLKMVTRLLIKLRKLLIQMV